MTKTIFQKQNFFIHILSIIWSNEAVIEEEHACKLLLIVCKLFYAELATFFHISGGPLVNKLYFSKYRAYR